MAVQPQTGIAMSEGNDDVMEEVPCAGGRVRRSSYLPSSFAACKDCVLSTFIQLIAHTSAQRIKTRCHS